MNNVYSQEGKCGWHIVTDGVINIAESHADPLGIALFQSFIENKIQHNRWRGGGSESSKHGACGDARRESNASPECLTVQNATRHCDFAIQSLYSSPRCNSKGKSSIIKKNNCQTLHIKLDTKCKTCILSMING